MKNKKNATGRQPGGGKHLGTRGGGEPSPTSNIPRALQKRNSGRKYPALPTSLDELIAELPLPVSWRPLEHLIRGMEFRHFWHIVVAGGHLALGDDDVATAIKQASQFYKQTLFRCCACFGYTDVENTFTMALPNGRFIFGATCPKCRKMIDAGKGTKTIERNMAAYLRGAE